MRLTLLKSPTSPDPHSDEGLHQFTYSLFPHEGDWRSGAIQRAYELNMPLLSVQKGAQQGTLPRKFSLVGSRDANLVVETVKLAEDNEDLIVRAYESHARRGEAVLKFGRDLEHAYDCNLMEEERKPIDQSDGEASLYVTPFQVRTIGAKLSG